MWKHAALALGFASLALACPASLDDRCAAGACDPRAEGGPNVPPAPVPPGCDPGADPRDAPACVTDGFAVYVQPKATGDGSKAAPLGSIQQAINYAFAHGIHRVYACDGTYDEHVVVEHAVSLYGGFACGTWEPSQDRGKVHPATPGFALHVKSLAPEDGQLAIRHLDFEAASAQGSGESSIGVFVLSSADVAFTDVRIAAGDGHDAKDAPDPPINWDTTTAQKGAPPTGLTGGAGQTCTCKVYGTSGGGGGGNAGNVTSHPNGFDGGNGTATPTVTGPPGATGNGGPGAVAGANGCGTGQYGANGLARSAGKKATVPGAISDAGWTPSAGTDGEAGNPGQGGGGGGGGLVTEVAGSGGGCGGCGGSGGKGGAGGGGSIALLVASSKVTLAGGAIETGSGGHGARGSNAQGGAPGAPGDQTAGACAGRAGGQGAGGGGGAGGSGGVAIGIAFAGTAPTVDGVPVPAHADQLAVVTKLGAAGGFGGAGNLGAAASSAPNGIAGNPGTPGDPGLDGVKAAVWSPP
jgi:hypothetical protein